MPEAKRLRRSLLAASLTTPFMLSDAFSEEAKKPVFELGPLADANRAGYNHEIGLDAIREVLGGFVNPASRSSLHKLADNLVSANVIHKDEIQSLHETIEVIFTSSSFDNLSKNISELAKDAKQDSDNVATALKNIASLSIKAVRKNLKDPEVTQAETIVATDLAGALAGAFQVVGKVPPPFLVPVAIIAAVTGSASGSFGAYYATKGK
ncbi:hypothetical protein CBA19CS22_33010 [Caballeronia novacaledonica]|uniref:Uncharacterized protein n=1 Tax=Caballeronia novacaledonica TaxID=1544861 RepID=A0ACB5R2P6_9BURK|nr:hypothetical protein [Caballeronia sp. NK8]BCQ30035.1 hypothetical protein NK8_82260 [Caballeronia sp. NK8]GJH21466.1 hypothetical protein CBA19CS22_33010 [Caballeronia novacaledonica]